MSKTHNLTGQRFGRLIALESVGSNKRKSRLWKCKCDCGREKITTSLLLVTNQTRSCGCLQKETISKMRAKNLVGKKFNKLTVLNKIGKIGKYIHWECRCDCGKITKIITASLINGNTKSCGCLTIERLKSMTGVNHPNWNHKLTIKEREHNKKYRKTTDPKFIEWSFKVKQRDNFICQKCLKNSKHLQSHHILGWLDYPDLRYDIDNGICLCINCHRQFHKIYGKRNFTKEHLDLFIRS